MRRGHPALTSDQTENAYRFGSIEYKPASRELIFENATCKLSPKEGELMLLLCKKMGGVMLRSEALQLIWGEESFFTNKTMDVYLARLRKYLESDSRVKIENVHSKGFRLVIAT
jgi:DNA-binding response OmpR family regulator